MQALQNGCAQDLLKKFEKKIRNEYRVETAFEEKRFYDLRRWNLMLDADVQTTYGMYIEQTGPDQYTYTVTPLGYTYNLKWLQHHYLFKIKDNRYVFRS